MLQSFFHAGIGSAICARTASMSACACSMQTPGFRRATGFSQCELAASSSAVKAFSLQKLPGPAAAVRGRGRSARPAARRSPDAARCRGAGRDPGWRGSPPKWVCHAAWLRITTRSAPGLILLGAEHPADERLHAEHAEMIGGDIAAVEPCRLAVDLHGCGRQRLRRHRLERSACSFSASNVRGRRRIGGRRRRRLQTRTMRSGLGKGSGFSSTPSTRLNIAVLAPMPSASTPIATSAKPGSRPSDGETVADVLQEILDPPRAAVVAMDLPHLLDAAEARKASRRACCGDRGPRAQRVVLGELEVGEHFVIELAIETVWRDQRQPVARDGVSVITPWRQNARDQRRGLLPVGDFDMELLRAGAGQRIELHLAIGFRDAPLRADPALLLEAHERRIDRSLAERAAGRTSARCAARCCSRAAPPWCRGS